MNVSIDPIREHLRTSKARRKSLNADWWTENNQANKLRAEIRRISEAVLRLETFKRELSEREFRMAKLTGDIKTEDDFQAELKSKLSEIASAKRLLKRFDTLQQPDNRSLIPGIPNDSLLKPIQTDEEYGA
jgi:predicted RNase H-like nuclease (RuvC/YqgF family)